MQITRRGILASILGSIVSGSALSIPKSVLAKNPDLNRYVRVIEMQRKLYATNKQYYEISALVAEKAKALGQPTPYVVYVSSKKTYIDKPLARPLLQPYKDIQNQAEELLSYMLKQFTPPAYFYENKEYSYLCSDLYEGRLNPDTMTVEGLMSIVDVIIPFAVMRRCVGIEKVPFNSNLIPSFNDFAKRYKEVVLGWSRPAEDVKRMYPEWAAAHNYT